MRLRPENEKLGTWKCPRGGVADVYQTTKRGRHFYTRCTCCGLVQGTGQALQQAIWDEAELVDKSVLTVPSGVVVGGANVVSVVEKDDEIKPEDETGDFHPGEIQGEPVAVEEKGFFSKLAPVAVVLAAAGVAVWMS